MKINFKFLQGLDFTCSMNIHENVEVISPAGMEPDAKKQNRVLNQAQRELRAWLLKTDLPEIYVREILEALDLLTIEACNDIVHQLLNYLISGAEGNGEQASDLIRSIEETDYL